MQPLLWILLASCAFVYIWNNMARVYYTIIIPATVKNYQQGKISGNKTLIPGVNFPASDEVQNFLAARTSFYYFFTLAYLLWPSLYAFLIVAKPENRYAMQNGKNVLTSITFPEPIYAHFEFNDCIVII